MDKETADKLWKDAEAILKKSFSGWDVKITSGRYNPEGYVDYKLRISEKGKTKESIDLISMASAYGLDTNHVHNHPEMGDITLVGYKSRARKYPFIVMQLETGDKFTITESMAERFFG